MKATARTKNASASLRLPKRKMSEAAFLKWCDEDTRAEWVDGEVVLMSPENVAHNNLHFFLAYLLGGFIEANELGMLLGDAVHVRFAKLARRRSPDLFFVSKLRLGLLKESHFEGAPDLIVELVSPDSQLRNYREKYDEYQAAGVREYWIVNPMSQSIEVLRLDRKRGFVPIPEKDGKIRSKVLKGFYLKPDWLWQKPLPNWLKLLKELGVR